MAISPRLAAILKAHAPDRLEGERLETVRATADYIRSAGHTPDRLRDANRVHETAKASMDAHTRLQAVCDAFGISMPENITPAQALKVLRKLSRKSQPVQAAQAGYTGSGQRTMRTVKPSQARRRERRARMRAMGQ